MWRIPVAGGESVQITYDGGFEALESWDKKTLYYTKATGTIFSPLFSRALAGDEERQVLGSASLLSFVVVEGGIYHVVGSSGQGSFGFEIRFLDFAAGKDQIRHKFVELGPAQG